MDSNSTYTGNHKTVTNESSCVSRQVGTQPVDEAAVWNAKALQDKVINANHNMRGEAWSPRLEVRNIITNTAGRYGVTIVEVMGREKNHRVTAARSAAIVAVHKAYPDWTYAKIAKTFVLDHSTVFYAIKKSGHWKPRAEGPERLRKDASLKTVYGEAN